MESFSQLEFDKIKKILANYCQSENAVKKALNLTVCDTKQQIENSLNIITECQGLLAEGYSVDFQGVVEIEDILYNYKYNAYSFQEFFKIYTTVRKALEIIKLIKKDEQFFRDNPGFLSLVNGLISLPEIKSRFEAIFSPDGEVLDTASPLLKQIRQRQLSLRKSILDNLDRKLKDNQLENIIQDKIITQRDGRYVIPLKDGGVNFLPGIVHGYSGSKATIFVEPNDIVSGNNELNSLKQEEDEEIYRIFCGFTSEIMEVKDDIFQNNKLLAELDYDFAAAKMGNYFGSSRPVISDKQIVKLVEARHPLLIHAYKSVDKVIPFDLTLGEEKSVFILSGPNTGGKTITLKAVGLLVLMAHCGLTVPVSDDSVIGIFDNIFTDINDDQSIENSLSTFSSHIEKIKIMLEKGNEKSLILIDEIGSATDPEQGAALAQAVLEELVAAGAVGIVTTHYTSLKVFAEKSDKCINSAMQFDPQKHQPTYHFKVGLPGNSFALEIARRLGLSGNVLQRAKELAGKKNVELTEIITKLSQEKKEISQLKYQYELKERLLKMKIKEREQLIEDFEKEKKNNRLQVIAEARDYLSTIQHKMNTELEKVINAEKKERKKQSQELQKTITENQHKLSQQEIEMTEQEYEPAKVLHPGDMVWVKEFNGTGRVVNQERGKVTVDVNGFFFTTTKKSLFQVKDNKITDRPGTDKVKKNYKTKSEVEYILSDVKTEIMVRGLTYEEAFPLVERFIDDGYTAGLNRLRIIHGKGMGILREKIRRYLKELNFVKEFYAPPQEMGGEGVTVVVFRTD